MHGQDQPSIAEYSCIISRRQFLQSIFSQHHLEDALNLFVWPCKICFADVFADDETVQAERKQIQEKMEDVQRHCG